MKFEDKCPFCAGMDLEVDSVPAARLADGKKYSIKCDNPECQAIGPLTNSEKEAWEKWRKRP